MDEDRFNMALRKFLKEVGVTSQLAGRAGAEPRGRADDSAHLRAGLSGLQAGSAPA